LARCALANGVDRRCGLAAILPEHMGIDLQRDARIGVPEALADRHDVHAGVDELRGVRVPQAVKRHTRHVKALGGVVPSRRHRIRRWHCAVDVGEQ
jgi:hypothetical protein